jgi:hypothetical protein
MRGLILIAGAALALSGCATMTTAEKVDFGCELAVLAAQATGDVATVAQQHGVDPVQANKLADRAAKGEDITRLVCGIASSVL